MKKCLMIGVALTIALSGVLAGCFGNGGSDGEQVGGYIQVPDGPKIKVVFTGPPELKVEWEKLGMADIFQVHLIGTLRNVSNQTVKFSEIGFLFDGHQVAFIYGRTLEPGEEMKILKGFPGYSESTKVLEVRIKGFEKIGSVAGTPEPTELEPTTPEPTTPAATLEVANFDLPELIELRKAIEEVITTARLIANEEERRLLSQTDVVLGAIQSDSKLHNLVAEKTEEDRLILDVLGGIFSVGVEHFYNIPSPVAWAITKGAEELGNRIAEWQVLGHLSFATVTQPDSGIMEVVYYKEQGEVWVNFDIYDPVGRVAMYIPVEPRLVSYEGRGNVVLSEGVRPVMERCRIAYRFGAISIPATPVPSVTGRIAFTSVRDGNAEIYIMNDDGSGQVRLTQSPASDFAPKWSPDGSKIAFLSDHEERNELVVINRDGSGSQVIAAAEEIYLPFAWSPDSSKIVFAADTGRTDEIIFANIDGSGSRVVLKSEDSLIFPMWTTTGDEVIYIKDDNEVKILNIRDDSINVLFDLDTILPVGKPWWGARGSAMALSPDGSHLAVAWYGFAASAFGNRRDDPPPSGIILIDVTGARYRGHHELEGARNKGFYLMLDWSPYSTRLAFSYEATYWFEAGEGSGWSTKDAQICTINIDGSKFVALTEELGEYLWLSWSPDGTKIAFHSDRGAPQIYVMNADGTNITQLTDSEGGNGYPAWFP